MDGAVYIVILFEIGSSLWVLFDASMLGVKADPRSKSLLNMGPGKWFVCCVLFWIVVFPLYLAKRGEYVAAKKKRDAETPPDDVPDWIRERDGK